MNNPIRVLIVDDSALVRKLLTEILQSDPAIDVVGTATDPYAARQKIKQLNPDVLTLDVAMPRMDGITFLGNLMRLHPMPVVMLSTLTTKGADTAIRALELGAIDFISKPVSDLTHNLVQYSDEIIRKVKTAATARVRPLDDRAVTVSGVHAGRSVAVGSATRSTRRCDNRSAIIAIGASTGGTEAIKAVLAGLPANAPATLVVQHIPAAFSAKFAEHVNEATAMNACLAKDGQVIERGHVYIAPGDRHLRVVRRQKRYYCEFGDDAPVNRHKPSVDVLFRSASECAGADAVGVLLTGMGKDGACGLRDMQRAGALTIAQDEETSVIWGMPGAAVELKAADQVLPLSGIPNALILHTALQHQVAADNDNNSNREELKHEYHSGR